MKKLFVLMLVLSIASFASAGLTWTDADGDDISTITLTSQSDTAVVYISSDTTAMGWFSGTIADTSVASFTAVTGDPCNMGHDGYASLYSKGGVNYVYGYVKDTTSPFILATGIWVEVTIHAVGDVTSLTSTTANTLGNGGTTAYAPNDVLVINHIPEPMTITLLGLGGLLLRRKK